ncbi:MAG: glycosyltransferase family 4 protein [Anaerolineales bacterium]
MIFGSLDQVSGGYLYDRQLVANWQDQGHQVEIISLPSRSYPEQLALNWDRYWRDHLTALELDALIQDELCHPALFHLNRQLHSRVNYPLISIVHHLRSVEDHPSLLLPLYRWIEKAYLNSVDGFIFNSKPTRVSVESLLGYEVSSVVAPPGRDHLEPGEAKPTDRSRTPSDHILRWLFVGNLIRRKGLHHLLSALESLAEYPWSLDVIGRTDLEPDYAKEMQARMQQPPMRNRVRFHGEVVPASLHEHYSGADALALPSSYEGFGLVYLEAMGYGLPVIATAAGGASELVESGSNGFLVNPGDQQQLRDCLRKYLSDPDLVAAHGRAARKHYLSHVTWEESAAIALEYIRTSFTKD